MTKKVVIIEFSHFEYMIQELQNWSKKKNCDLEPNVYLAGYTVFTNAHLQVC